MLIPSHTIMYLTCAIREDEEHGILCTFCTASERNNAYQQIGIVMPWACVLMRGRHNPEWTGLTFVGCHCKSEMESSIALQRQEKVLKQTIRLEFVQVH